MLFMLVILILFFNLLLFLLFYFYVFSDFFLYGKSVGINFFLMFCFLFFIIEFCLLLC